MKILFVIILSPILIVSVGCSSTSEVLHSMGDSIDGEEGKAAAANTVTKDGRTFDINKKAPEPVVVYFGSIPEGQLDKFLECERRINIAHAKRGEAPIRLTTSGWEMTKATVTHVGSWFGVPNAAELNGTNELLNCVRGK